MERKQIVKKSLVLAQPDRVWAALTDTRQLRTWFGAEFLTPLVAGARVDARLVPTQVLPQIARLRKHYTGLPFELDIERMEPSRLLAFRWSPFAFFNPEAKADGTSHVVIEIAPDPQGSRLTVTELDFEGITSERLEKAVETNASGWSRQILQLELFLSGAIDLRPIKD